MIRGTSTISRSGFDEGPAQTRRRRGPLESNPPDGPLLNYEEIADMNHPAFVRDNGRPMARSGLWTIGSEAETKFCLRLLDDPIFVGILRDELDRRHETVPPPIEPTETTMVTMSKPEATTILNRLLDLYADYMDGDDTYPDKILDALELLARKRRGEKRRLVGKESA